MSVMASRFPVPGKITGEQESFNKRRSIHEFKATLTIEAQVWAVRPGPEKTTHVVICK